MKKVKRLLVALMSVVMVVVSFVSFPTAIVKAEETTTKDSWVDPGNYTRGWYDSVTDLDTYGNTGAEDDPYEIKSAKDLAGLAYYSNITSTDSATTDFGGKYIEITAESIDLSAHYWYPIGAVQNFKGTVEGNNVTIENMFIGSASKYETCGKVGLFGSVYANISNIAVKNAFVYSNSTYAGGFAGIWCGGNITNCSVEGNMNHITASSYAGGFVGIHNTAACVIKNCYANMQMTCTSVSSHIGGFAGYVVPPATSNFENCYATGNVSSGDSCCTGGFAGLLRASKLLNCYGTGTVSVTNSCCVGGFCGDSAGCKIVQCFSTGNVTTGTGCWAGGFIGRYYTYTGSTYNSYALGNIVAGINSSIGGFIGVLDRQYAQTDYIENCYSAGSTKAGSGSAIGGFCGNHYYTNGTAVYKKDYWNISATQILNGASRSKDEKVGIVYGEFRTVVATYQDYMQTSDFAADLNEYVNQNADLYDTWEVSENVNFSYPYITGNKEALFEITGDSQDVKVGDAEASSSMNVYGTLIFAEPSETESGSGSSSGSGTGETDSTISVGLQWGSLEYVYTAGDYDKETETYADGSWSAKEAGVTDKITITNSTDQDVQATYAFTASAETGNYTDLTGEFVQEDEETVITDPVIVRAKEGDIVANQNVFLKINGIPKEQKSVTSPELIGNVVVSISKYAEQVTPENPESTETPVTEEVSETEAPVVTYEPESTEVPEVTVAPESSEEVVISEGPVISEAPEATEDVKETENVPEISAE